MSDVEPSGHVLGSASQPVVVLERELRATPEEVWSAWTEPERAARWLGALEAPRHAQHSSERALLTTAGLGAGWEGFVDWLEDALADREHGVDRYEQFLPRYEARVARLSRVSRGTVENGAVRPTRVIAASPEEIWDLLTTPAGLARWLGRVVEGRLEAGGRVMVVHDESTPEIRQSSLVTEWEPPCRLAMTWDYTGEPTSSLELSLRPEGDYTRLELIHRGVANLADDYRVGWHAHLDLLVAEAEGWGRPPWASAFDAARVVG